MPDNTDEKRYLIAFGASEYDHRDFPRLERVIDDVNRVTAFFTSGVQGYQRVLTDKLSMNASAAKVRAAVKRWFASTKRRSTDRVIFYFAGHGDTGGNLNHYYLFTKNSDPEDLTGTAISSKELVEWFFEGENPRPRNLLVILDTCYSGKGAGQAAAMAANAVGTIFKEASEGLWIIASARPLDEAGDGRFVDALLEVTKDPAWGDRSQPFLSPLDIVTATNKWFENKKRLQRADGYAVAFRAYPEFIRNINCHPGQAGLVLTDEAHWDPKARGVESITEVGWYFTGRHAALRTLVNFLTTEHSDHRACLVTGAPGSGKSSVLARLVTCAHPEMRKYMEEAQVLKGVPLTELPPLNSVDVAIYAKSQTIDQVVMAIASACGLSESDPSAVLKALSARKKPLRIVIDALDEAQRPDELDLELLRPLAELPTVRLIVSSRCPRKDRPPLGEHAEVLDLDEKYFEETDIEGYVIRYLQRQNPATPYSRLHLNEIAQIARVVAHKAQKSFLFARIVSRSLANADRTINTQSPDWQGQLPSCLAEVFEQDLSRFRKVQRDTFIDLMVPLAYACGRGLPWQLFWSRLASAIAQKEYTNCDIRELRNSAGYYLIEDKEEEVSVYRLFHEEFAHYLREETASQGVECTIAETLIRMVPEDNSGPRWDWVYQPYLLKHLSTHAAQDPRLLDTLILDPQYLIRADPVRLVSAMDLTQMDQDRLYEAGEFRDVYRLTQHYLQCSKSLDERLAYLELTAHEQRAPYAIAALRALTHRNSWRVLWAQTRPMTPHRVVNRCESPITALALGDDPKGRMVVASVGIDGSLRISDIGTGNQLLDLPLKGHDEGIIAVVLGKDKDGKRMIVTSSKDLKLRGWNIDTGMLLLEAQLNGVYQLVTALSLGKSRNGGQVIVSGSLDGTLRVWDLETEKQLLYSPMKVMKVHEDAVTAVAVLGRFHDGRNLIVSASIDGTMQVCLDTGEQLREMTLEGDDGYILALASGVKRDGQQVIIALTNYQRLRIWNLDTWASLLNEQMEGPEYLVSAIAMGEGRDGRKVIVSASHGGTLRVWDLDIDASRLYAPLKVHEDAVTALVLGEDKDGQKVIVSGSADRTVRVWDLDTGDPKFDSPLKGHDRAVTAVALAKDKDGRKVILSGSRDGIRRVWDLDTGHEILSSHLEVEGHKKTATELLLGAGQEGRKAIVPGSNGTLRVWDPGIWEARLDSHLKGRNRMARIVFVKELRDGRWMAVSESMDGLLVCDLNTGEPMFDSPLKVDEYQAVALGEDQYKREVIVSASFGGTLRVWKLDSGQPLMVVIGLAPIRTVRLYQGTLVLGTNKGGLLALRI